MKRLPSIQYSRRIPIRHDVDVFVAGGGPAGVTAALAAARQGATTYLAEAHSCLGGMGTAGLVPAFMPFTDGRNFLAGGLGREIHDTLIKSGGAIPGITVAIQAEALKRLYDSLLLAAGVRFTFHTQVIDTVVVRGRVTQAICAGKRGLFAVRARVFIDGTGDGDLAARSGAAFKQGDAAGHTMPATLCSLWANVDWKAVAHSKMGNGDKLEQAFKDKVFTLEDRHLPGMWRVSDTFGGGNIGHCFDLDGTDEESLTRALIWGRKSMLEYEKYYKNYLKGFERMELAATGSLLGVRETRRITGDYVLCLDDFQRRASFEDEIGRNAYSVDIHVAKPDKASFDKFIKEFTTLRFKEGESFGIPYRTLTPKGLRNVLVAGRCISTDRFLQSSVRIMPCCFVTGQAAGAAAAQAARSKTADVHAVDVQKLRRTLARMGAYLPKP